MWGIFLNSRDHFLDLLFYVVNFFITVESFRRYFFIRFSVNMPWIFFLIYHIFLWRNIFSQSQTNLLTSSGRSLKESAPLVGTIFMCFFFFLIVFLPGGCHYHPLVWWFAQRNHINYIIYTVEAQWTLFLVLRMVGTLLKSTFHLYH